MLLLLLLPLGSCSHILVLLRAQRAVGGTA